MKRIAALLVVASLLQGCSALAPNPRALPPRADIAAQEAVLLSLADGIFAAARARDADRFASFFSDRPDFVYLINRRRITSREALRTTFHSVLSRHESFDVRWGDRTVQMLTPESGVVTGEFRTVAKRVSGEQAEASGVVTFVAVREASGWRVVNWHTTE